MKRPKGPELKMPQFLVDLYWDLRDRHLLPLVALGLVAIVAVPFLLGGDSEGPAPRSGRAKALGAGSARGDSASRFAVVEAKPGLRDYHERLKHRSPANPFKQQYTSAANSAEGEVEVTTPGGESPGGGGGTPGSGPSGPTTLIRYTTAVDVKVTTTKTLPSGKKETSGPVLHKRVIPVAPLPNEKVQAVAYMGASPETNHPILLVSDAVTAIFGEGICLSGAETCQLLEVEPGMPETFVFGPESVRYKIVVLNPRPVAIGTAEAP